MDANGGEMSGSPSERKSEESDVQVLETDDERPPNSDKMVKDEGSDTDDVDTEKQKATSDEQIGDDSEDSDIEVLYVKKAGTGGDGHSEKSKKKTEQRDVDSDAESTASKTNSKNSSEKKAKKRAKNESSPEYKPKKPTKKRVPPLFPRKKTCNGINYYMDEYEVEKILDIKYEDGVIKYKIKWLKYDDVTWEPKEDVYCPDLLEKFNAERRAAGLVNTADLNRVHREEKKKLKEARLKAKEEAKRAAELGILHGADGGAEEAAGGKVVMNEEERESQEAIDPPSDDKIKKTAKKRKIVLDDEILATVPKAKKARTGGSGDEQLQEEAEGAAGHDFLQDSDEGLDGYDGGEVEPPGEEEMGFPAGGDVMKEEDKTVARPSADQIKKAEQLLQTQNNNNQQVLIVRGFHDEANRSVLVVRRLGAEDLEMVSGEDARREFPDAVIAYFERISGIDANGMPISS